MKNTKGDIHIDYNASDISRVSSVQPYLVAMCVMHFVLFYPI